MNDLDVALLSRCFFPPERQARADVAIVFGMSAPERPVARAVEIFRAGLADSLLFTGGHNPRLGQAEALEMARLAREQGVPREAILVEDQALHTEQNVEFSFRLLQDRLGVPGGIGSIMILTIQYHLRRAHLAARRRFPGETGLSWSCYPSRHYTAENWFEVAQGRRDVTAEIDKIERYYGLTPGDLARQPQ